MKIVFRYVTFMIIAGVMAWAPAPAAAGTSRPGVQKILLRQGSQGVLAQELASMLVGDGVQGIASAAWSDSQGGHVVWRVIRDEQDELGGRHVFYRQYFLPPSWVARDLEPGYAKKGIQVFGSEIGLHYSEHGELELVFGTQVPDLKISNQLAVFQRREAYNMAQEEAAVQPDFHPADRSTWTPDLVEGQIKAAKLLLWNDGMTASWRYAWEVPTLDAFGLGYRIVMDAGTGQVLELQPTAVDHTCSPSSNTNEAATANPQNPSILNRNLWATPASDRGPSFVAEAHRAPTYGVPDVQIFQGWDSPVCNGNGWYQLLPLPQGSDGRPLYDGASRTTYPGSVAGDAMWFTYETMQTIHNLGRNGWDGSGGPAKVVVDAHYPVWYQDAANFTRVGDAYAPANSVVVLKAVQRPYALSAAIDIIGHEWGHGVIYTSANFPYSDTVGAQLHEGFADVVGYITEFANQQQGSGPEKADWKAGEDSFSNGRWDRRVDDAVWPAWLRAGYHYFFHKDDTNGDPIEDVEAHNRGNMLPVAFRLLDVGGHNPICSRPGWSGEDCNVSVTGQGFYKAKKIFFYTLTHFCTSTTQWEDLPDLMKFAAFRLYGHCTPGKPGNPALTEQHAVSDAFTAIGYLSSGYYECPS